MDLDASFMSSDMAAGLLLKRTAWRHFRKLQSPTSLWRAKMCGRRGPLGHSSR